MKGLFPILAFTFLLVQSACQEKKSNAPKYKTSSRPNIIIVFADDMGYGDLGYHGNPWLKTPNLDQFASESLELTNFHVGTTCTPSRAGLMTGRNANRSNTWHTIAGCSILLPDEETIAEVYLENGYQTAMLGKWHLGDNYPYRPQDRGFHKAFYHGGGGVGQTPDYWGNDYFDDTYFRNGVPEKVSGYCTDVWFDEAIDFIDRNKEGPFFLYLATNAAHAPFNVPETYVEPYKKAPLAQEQKRFNGMIANIDENFGKLTTNLKKNKLFDNTIIIFTTDNGTARGIQYVQGENKPLGYNAGLRGTKGSHYDGGHRVPFFLSWPNGNLKQKDRIKELAAHVDMLPTLLELSGIAHHPKKPWDGTSIAPILKGKQPTLDRMLIVDTQRNQWPVKGRNSCVMSTDWRLVNGNELYNIEVDPGQKNNVANEHSEMVSKMQAFYEDWWATVVPDIAYAEIPLGYDAHTEVQLTIHDMHTVKGLPWNQGQIRKADLDPDGFYAVAVVKTGRYAFELRRYPKESDLSIGDSASEIPKLDYKDGLPQARAIDVEKAVLQIGEQKIEVSVDDENTHAVLETWLEEGSYELRTHFISKSGNKIPAYYTLARQIPTN